MNWKCRIIFFFSLVWCSVVWTQTSSRFELASGVEFGWWLHRLGTDTSGGFGERGVAKTHHSGTLFLSSSWIWHFKKWGFGPVLQGSLLLEDDMRGPFDSRRRAQRIQIARDNHFVTFVQYGVQVEYQLLRRGAYALVPAYRYGHFQMWTLHPDQDNFGYRHFNELVIQHHWHGRKRIYLLRMNYKVQRIFLKEPALPDEQHHLYSWGLSLGMRF